MDKLSEKQKLLVKYYTGACNFNATQAAIRAGYSPASAHVTACLELKNPKVRAAIDAELDKLFKASDEMRDKIIREQSKIAFADTSTVVKVDTIQGVDALDGEEEAMLKQALMYLDTMASDEDDGPEAMAARKIKRKIEEAMQYQTVRVANTDELPDEIRHAIQSIKQTQHGVEIKLYDKQKALDSLARIFGMNDDRVSPGEGWDELIKNMGTQK